MKQIQETRGSMDQKRVEFLKKDLTQGFTEYLGLKAELVEYGIFHTRINIRPEHLQQDGFVHAGVMATMADHTAGYAAFTTIPEDHRILTIEFKLNFFKPAKGDALLGRSKVISQGKQVIVSESEIFIREGENEKLVAKALVTLISVPASKIAGR